MTFRTDHTTAEFPSLPSEDGERAWCCGPPGVATIVGLAAGGIASSHLTSSLSDYDAPGSAVVLAQHQIQRATGANPEEGYEVVVRTAAPIGASSPLPSRVGAVVALLRARPEVKSVYDYANTGDSTMISGNGKLTVVVATVGNVQEKQAVTALEHAIAAQPATQGQYLARGAHRRRRADRCGVLSGPGSG